jgi:hypothetical protein
MMYRQVSETTLKTHHIRKTISETAEGGKSNGLDSS